MSLLKAADSSGLCDVPMDTEHKNGNKEADSANLSEECKTNNALKQSEDDGQPKEEGDGNPDSDGNDTDLEVFLTFSCTMYYLNLLVPVTCLCSVMIG